MRIDFRNDPKCRLYYWSHILKYWIFWVIFLFFIIFSLYFLTPDKKVNHDKGYISSELTQEETTEKNITRISYVNSAGEITYAIDKKYAVLTQIKDEKGQILEEYYSDENEEPINCYGYFGISYKHREKEEIDTYIDTIGNPIVTIEGYSTIVHSFNESGQTLDDMYYDINMKPQMCPSGYYGIHREYNKEGFVNGVVYLNMGGTPGYSKSGVAREKYVIDKDGRIMQKFFLDLENNPVSLQLGQAGEAYTYDENNRIVQITYLDQDGNPMKTTSGYTILKKSYYRDGTEKTNMYFDASGNPVSLSKGQYGIKRVGDLTLYLNKNGQIMLCLVY